MGQVSTGGGGGEPIGVHSTITEGELASSRANHNIIVFHERCAGEHLVIEIFNETFEREVFVIVKVRRVSR